MNQRTLPQRSISVAIALSAAAVMYGVGISVGPVRLLPIMALFVAAAAWFGGLIVGWVTLTLIVAIALLFGEVWVSAIRSDVLMVFLIMGVALLHGSAIAFRMRRREVEVKDVLALQQDLLRVVIDGVPMAIGYMDCDQRYRLWNRAFGDLVGVSGRNDADIRELFGEETYAELLPLLEGAYRGTPTHGRIRIRDGDVRYVDAHFQPHSGRSGGTVGIVSLMHDVTGQVRVLDVVRSSEARLRSLAMASASIIWIASRDGRLIEAQGWLEFTGQVPLHYTGHGWLEAVHPAEREYVRGAMREAFTAGRPLSLQYRLYSRESGYRMVHSHAVPVHGADVGIIEWVGTIRDIDDHYHVQQALLLRERERDALLENVPHMVWMADVHGDIVFYNSRWYDYTALCPGQHWKTVTHPEDIDEVSALWERSLGTGEKLMAEKRVRRASDGQYRWHLVQGVPIRNEDGAIVRWYGSMTDIEDQKRAIATLSQSNQRLSHFLATLSHELRNPISGILTGCELLEHRELHDAKRPPVMATISRHGVHLQRMLDDLLDVSRVTAGTIELKRGRCDLVRVLGDLIDDMAPETSDKRLVVVLHVAPDTAVPIWGDAIRLRQIFMNLISNAIKASSEDGCIDIRVERRGGECEIRVIDQGEGLAEDVRDKLFKPFVQADDWRSRGLGLGLGLSIVHQLTALHGGHIVVDEPGPKQSARTGHASRGACFIVRFPLCGAGDIASQPPAVAQQSAGESLPGNAPSLRILLIEDERENAEALRWLLELDGYRVDLAFTAVDGISQATSGGYDVVLCDIELTDELNGLDVARALAPLPDRPRLVAYSGYGQPKDFARTREAGFDAHLVKPATISSIKKVIAAR